MFGGSLITRLDEVCGFFYRLVEVFSFGFRCNIVRISNSKWITNFELVNSGILVTSVLRLQDVLPAPDASFITYVAFDLELSQIQNRASDLDLS